MSPWFEAFHYGYLLKAMLAAGADRIGASASVAIATGGSSASGY